MPKVPFNLDRYLDGFKLLHQPVQIERPSDLLALASAYKSAGDMASSMGMIYLLVWCARNF